MKLKNWTLAQNSHLFSITEGLISFWDSHGFGGQKIINEKLRDVHRFDEVSVWGEFRQFGQYVVRYSRLHELFEKTRFLK